MKAFLLTATYLVGIGELILAIFFWATHSKSEIRKVMALLALSTGLWVVFGAFIAYKPTSELNHFLEAVVFGTGALILTTLFHLVIIFPYRTKAIDSLHIILLYLPSIIFSATAIFTNSISHGSSGTETFVGSVIPGPFYPIYNFFLILFFFASVILIIYKIKKSTGFHKKILTQFLFAVLIGASPAVFLDLFAHFIYGTYFGNYLVGSISTVFWLGFVTYVVLKK